MILMMIIVMMMMTTCNLLLMRLILSFCLLIQSKVRNTANLKRTEECNYSSIFGIIVCLLLTPSFIVVMQASDPLRFQNLTQTLEFQYQALANGVAQHADQRRVEIEKEKMEKAAVAS